MKNFFSEAAKEFEHVVWPTNKETKQYLTVVLSMIVILTIVLFLVSTMFSSAFMALRTQVQAVMPAPVQATNTASGSADLSKVLKDINVTGVKTTPVAPTKTK